MDDYAGRVLADRYRLPLAPADEDGGSGAYGLVETRAFDTYSGQEVMVRQLPLPETVDAEVVDADDPYRRPQGRAAQRTAVRATVDPAVRRAVEAVQAVARIPDHPRLDQVFDVFTEGGSLWIVSELIDARPLAALVRDEPLTAYRAAEIASDVLTALRALHVHGWTHRNVTARTVLVCDDGRVVLSGLAAGAAEEALCGYAPVPLTEDAEVHPYEEDDAGDEGAYEDDGEYGFDGAYDEDGDEDDEAVGAFEGEAGRDGYGDAYDDGSGAYDDGSGAYDDVDAYADRPYDRPAHGSHRDGSHDDGYGGGAYGGAGRGGRYVPAHGTAPAPLPPGPPALPSGYEPQYVAQAADRIADDGDDAHYTDTDTDVDVDDAHHAGHDLHADADADDEPGAPPGQAGHGPARQGHVPGPHAPRGRRPGGGPPRALLAGTWRDGPVSAGGGRSPYGDVAPYGGARAALSADAQRRGTQPPQPRREAPAHVPVAAGAGSADGGAYRGPGTPLEAERARQARIALVGAVTERWAPEQAGPVHGTWQLAPPIGPATDLWALGALLFRVLQGHAPYPEDSAAELVQMVCSEPPAYAEDCGALRPVVESLLRQDPTERPDVEELRGWLRSLVRSAPEPDAGASVVPMPSVDAARLPIVRRRGDLVRRRRAAAAPSPARHRHKKARDRRQSGGSPRALGRTLLLLILLALGAALAYAAVFMPKAGTRDESREPTGTAVPTATTPHGQVPAPAPEPSLSPSPGGQAPSTNAVTPTAPALPEGYVVRDDPEGFRIGVDRTWRRSPINDIGQVRYSDGDFTLIVVPGRDTVRTAGADPLEYQRAKERELQPWRDSSWATASGLRRVDVGRQAMAEGQFTWQDANGRQVYVRNLALLVGDRYHVVQVIGPEVERDRVSEVYEQATRVYRTLR
ncbi:protein kinase [Streptomyces kanasensis]|uniref:protein kinase n=1 Tax=Streptomyces kanasensis TaxID=936756 RepID=UPI003700608A